MRKIAVAVALSGLALSSGCVVSDFLGLRLPPADNLFGWIGDLL